MDPGLATTGGADFGGPPPPGGTLTDAVRLLLDCGRVETAAATPMPARLLCLANGMRAIAAEKAPERVVIEIPTYSGQYARHGPAQRQGVNKLYQAIGALEVGLRSAVPGDIAVEQVRAIQESKETRNDLLEHSARIADIELPSGPRGGSRQNILDAIWLGCEALL